MAQFTRIIVSQYFKERLMSNLGLRSAHIAVATYSVLMLLALVALPAGAQTFRGTILGTVTDASGAAIAGSTVTA